MRTKKPISRKCLDCSTVLDDSCSYRCEPCGKAWERKQLEHDANRDVDDFVRTQFAIKSRDRLREAGKQFLERASKAATWEDHECWADTLRAGRTETVLEVEAVAQLWTRVQQAAETDGWRKAIEALKRRVEDDLLELRFAPRYSSDLSNGVDAARGRGARDFREQARGALDFYARQDEARAQLAKEKANP